MSRLDLTDSQLLQLERWAQQSVKIDREEGDRVLRVIAELRRLRDQESATRMLSEIEGEV